MKLHQTFVLGLALLCSLATNITAQSTDSTAVDSAITVTDNSSVFKNWILWKKLELSNDHLRNIGDTLYNNVSISLFPFCSTNGKLSINTINRYSINLIAGYSKGVEVMEVGWLLNIDNGDVRYLQYAGFMNIVSGNVLGFQIAGFTNVVGKTMTGLQFAGFTNVVMDTVRGMQVSGFSNINRRMTNGIQFAGFANIVSDDMNGIQSAGFINTTAKNTIGMQFAGFGNYSSQMVGIQGSGFYNFVQKTMDGIQMAGFINTADSLNGLQVSGFINVAKHVKGGQIGYINISKTCDGLPIGFFSYVHTGYHKIELATDERLITTLAFRTGVDKFHNIFFAGSNFAKSDRMLTVGYGIGTSLKYREKIYFDIDLTAQTLQISPSGQNWNQNSLNKLFVGVEFRPYKKLSVAVGPTLNVWVANSNDVDYVNLSQNLPTGFYSYSKDNTEIKAWIGGKLSVKFL
jgi:hypothetical protein